MSDRPMGARATPADRRNGSATHPTDELSSTDASRADAPLAVLEAPDFARVDGLGGQGQRGSTNHRFPLGGRRDLPQRSLPAYGAGRPDTARWPAEEATLLRGARVLVIDDHLLYRDYLASVIAAHGAAFAGSAWDQESLMSALHETRPRVVLLNMATRASATLLRQALAMGPAVRVIVIGVSEDDESEIVACAEAGVAGYHTRTDSLKTLLHLIQRVADGESICSPKVSAILLRRLSALAADRQPVDPGPVLTAREDQILRMLELGLSNREIAEKLCIAVHTVKNHVHSLLKKLGVGTRSQAAALSRAVRSGEDYPEN